MTCRSKCIVTKTVGLTLSPDLQNQQLILSVNLLYPGPKIDVNCILVLGSKCTRYLSQHTFNYRYARGFFTLKMNVFYIYLHSFMGFDGAWTFNYIICQTKQVSLSLQTSI